MEKYNKKNTSIYGKWWQPIRKWFYPTWLAYELSIRFYDYAISIHNYFLEWQNYFTAYIREIGIPILAIFCSLATFIICTAFLTLPTCFVLYKFFALNNLTQTQFEEKIKKYF